MGKIIIIISLILTVTFLIGFFFGIKRGYEKGIEFGINELLKRIRNEFERTGHLEIFYEFIKRL